MPQELDQTPQATPRVGGRGPSPGGRPRGMPAAMVISLDPRRGRSTVRLVGELDLASAPQLGWALPQLAGQEVVVDLSRLAFIDAAGLSSLLLARSQLLAAGRRMSLRGAQGAVRRLFALTGLEDLLEEAG